MPVKKYGIYINYSIHDKLKSEGLGRYLAALLKAAANRTDIKFVISCPRRFKKNLLALCESEAVSLNNFDILTLKKNIFFSRLTKLNIDYQSLPNKKNKTREMTISINNYSIYYEKILKYAKFFLKMLGIHLVHKKIQSYILYFSMLVESRESITLVTLLNQCTDIQAWYSPAAFWPSFNLIKTPRLMCVPDLVLTEFPIEFASLDNNFKSMEATKVAIKDGEYYVTYSDHIKKSVLLEKFSITTEKVDVIRHAPNDLSAWVTVKEYCLSLFAEALINKSFNPNYTATMTPSIKFLFYASQFRPSKNIITLLRCYKYLLRKRYIGHKLILTGNPSRSPTIHKFICEYHLQNDVICLQDLSASELAACYKLADLAINPSLSEGACPFTFTEALSVDTPVVMANIAVTNEIITDPDLRKMMLFDPYDWKNMADCVEKALNNKINLLTLQKKVYYTLAKRTWSNVLDEYIAILDRISTTNTRHMSNYPSGNQYEII